MTIGHVEVSDQVSIPLAVVRRVARPADLPRLVPEGCGLVWKFVQARNLNAGRNVALYWDGAIHLDVGVEMMDSFADDEGVVHSATPAGRTASVMHLGPYGELGAAHDAILTWCRVNKRELAGPSWEIYGHWQKEWNKDPSQIRTDVFYQLR